LGGHRSFPGAFVRGWPATARSVWGSAPKNAEDSCHGNGGRGPLAGFPGTHRRFRRPLGIAMMMTADGCHHSAGIGVRRGLGRRFRYGGIRCFLGRSGVLFRAGSGLDGGDFGARRGFRCRCLKVRQRRIRDQVRCSQNRVRCSQVPHVRNRIRHSHSLVRHCRNQVRHSHSLVRHSRSQVRHSQVRHVRNRIRHVRNRVRGTGRIRRPTVRVCGAQAPFRGGRRVVPLGGSDTAVDPAQFLRMALRKSPCAPSLMIPAEFLIGPSIASRSRPITHGSQFTSAEQLQLSHP
jgi:hypothetical protein